MWATWGLIIDKRTIRRGIGKAKAASPTATRSARVVHTSQLVNLNKA